jgi:hypothetical protein
MVAAGSPLWANTSVVSADAAMAVPVASAMI